MSLASRHLPAAPQGLKVVGTRGYMYTTDGLLPLSHHGSPRLFINEALAYTIPINVHERHEHGHEHDHDQIMIN